MVFKCFNKPDHIWNFWESVFFPKHIKLYSSMGEQDKMATFIKRLDSGCGGNWKEEEGFQLQGPPINPFKQDVPKERGTSVWTHCSHSRWSTWRDRPGPWLCTRCSPLSPLAHTAHTYLTQWTHELTQWHIPGTTQTWVNNDTYLTQHTHTWVNTMTQTWHNKHTS